jgi:hypothetical protein
MVRTTLPIQTLTGAPGVQGAYALNSGVLGDPGGMGTPPIAPISTGTAHRCECVPKTQKCAVGRCSPIRKNPLFPTPDEDVCDPEWTQAYGGSPIYSNDGLISDISDAEWRQLQDKIAGSDRASMVRQKDAGTGAAQVVTLGTVAQGLAVGERFLSIGIGVRVAFQNNGQWADYTMQLAWTDEYGAARVSPTILMFPTGPIQHSWVGFTYLTGKRLTPCLGELVGAAPVSANPITLTVDNIPATAAVTAFCFSSTVLAAFRGQY